METFEAYVNRISILKAESMNELRKCFKPAELKKEAYFIQSGKYANKIAFLQKGIVRAFFINQEGKEYNKQFFIGPTIIGAYSSLLSKQVNKIAQQAMSDCEIYVANYVELEKLFDKYHDIERLGRKLAEYYFLEKEQKELEMALLHADERYLLMRERFPGIESSIPQYHIASYLGISPTQLSRIRRKLSE